MNSYDIRIHIFWNLCNHSCPWLTILSTFGEALMQWLRKTLKEGWLKIINSPQELLCTHAPSIDESNNKESSTATLILFGPRLSRLCCRSEGTAALPHPLPSRRRRGKIAPIVVVLRSNNDASSHPPPPSSRVVHRPPPHMRTFLPPLSPCPPPSPVRSHQSALVAANATTSPPPPSSPPTVAALWTSILAKNAAAALLLLANARDVVSDGGRGGRQVTYVFGTY